MLHEKEQHLLDTASPLVERSRNYRITKQTQQINKFLARNSPSKENRMNFLNFRNELKEKRKRYRNIT